MLVNFFMTSVLRCTILDNDAYTLMAASSLAMFEDL